MFGIELEPCIFFGYGFIIRLVLIAYTYNIKGKTGVYLCVLYIHIYPLTASKLLLTIPIPSTSTEDEASDVLIPSVWEVFLLVYSSVVIDAIVSALPASHHVPYGKLRIHPPSLCHSDACSSPYAP